MRVTDTKLTNVKIVEVDVFGNHRGFFTESYSETEFAKHGLDYDFTQGNRSLSAEAGVLRGLRFQKGEVAQTRLIRVVTGAVLDVVVDIRRDNPTRGRRDEFILSERNHRQLLAPKEYARGFVTLTPNVNFLYKYDDHYNAEADGGIALDDPGLTIDWPIDPSRAIMSEKDRRHPTLEESETENPSVYGEI